MEVRHSKFGRGVFATRDYSNGEIIEVCPVIVLDEADTKIIDKTILYNYYFSWGADIDKAAIALGNGSLYNHSYHPNAKYIKKFDKDEVHFVAIKTILNGEEIFVNYNHDPKSNAPLWFDADPDF